MLDVLSSNDDATTTLIYPDRAGIDCRQEVGSAVGPE
jgi:hypothetical protein